MRWHDILSAWPVAVVDRLSIPGLFLVALGVIALTGTWIWFLH